MVNKKNIWWAKHIPRGKKTVTYFSSGVSTSLTNQTQNSETFYGGDGVVMKEKKLKGFKKFIPSQIEAPFNPPNMSPN
jgi:hypothetical protein